MFPGTTIKINFQDFLTFIQLLRDNAFNITNKNFFITKFSIFFVNNNFDEIKSKINLNAKESKMIVMNQIELFDHNQKIIYSIHVFENTLMLASENDTTKFLSENQHIPILFLHKKGKIPVISKEINNDSIFQEENENLKNKFVIQQSNEIFRKIWSFIIPCITGYLIKKSYEKTKKDRTLNHIHDSNRITVKKEDFVVLRNLGIGSIFRVDLIYHLKRCELMAMKIPHFNDDEVPKLIKREKENYKKLNHIFLPKFFDTPEGENYLVMEFINGKTLNYIDRDKLSYNDAVTIVFELIVIFEYLHSKKLIYRDLKPNNIIIDENKNAVLIDFDRLISNNPDGEYTSNLGGLGSVFLAPEIHYGKISEKCDIYSLGMMIRYIMGKKALIGHFTRDHTICSIIQYSTNPEPEFRLDVIYTLFLFVADFYPLIHVNCISDIFVQIFSKYKNTESDPYIQYNIGVSYFLIPGILKNKEEAIPFLTLAANKNHPYAQYQLGVIFLEGKYISRDINKAIYYLTPAANGNIPEAQYHLGVIYYEGKYTSQDINKAIHYFTLAANQGFPQALFSLGTIYSEDKYFSQDIDKAIHYLTLAANQNIPEANLNIGVIYFEGKYISRDIDKAIHYFTLAANQNYPQAQYNLGVIYSEGKCISKDINKAIYFYTLAANNNFLSAQYNLGVIYSEGKFVQRDAQKALYYLTLAAKQNYSDAQNSLGIYYAEGKCVQRDIYKAIHYFSLAANQNHPQAQNSLGVIFYSDEKYGKQGFDKAIHYLSLAANQNHIEAQFNLGFLYYEGKFKSRDIQKAIHYFTLCANQRFSEAQYMLGNIYHKGKYISPDINKAIYYYTLAANQNHSKAQYYLGLMYYEGKYIERNIKKGILLVNLASINRFFPAHFVVGCLYHQGKYIDRDIEQAIHYYKEGSSFNDKYAKNNLAIIYKMGYKDKIPARTMNAIEYLKEAIHKKNDILAKYNLANIYIYDETIRDKIDDAIELLFNSIEFPHSYILLFIALLKKYGFKLNEIEKHITELNNKNPKSTLPPISDDLCRLGLNNDSTYKILYEIFKDDYLVYDPLHKIVCFSDFLMQNNKKGNQINVPNITNEFYEGFGIEI